MAARNHPPTEPAAPGGGTRLFWLGMLLLPIVLLLIGCVRVTGDAQNLLWLGIVCQVLGCILILLARPGGQQLVGTPVIMLYVIALSWLLLAAQGLQDWYFHLARSLMLVVPLTFFALQCLRDSGALGLRKARLLADRLSKRLDWPADLQGCRVLPEVKALREALQVDASPALNLLLHEQLQVRVAALAALEYRQTWQIGQPEMLLHLAKHTMEPEIKIGVVQALANLEERLLMEPLSELMFDPVPQVRHVAIEALLWNTEQRWSWLRSTVRTALAHPNAQHDGPLFRAGPLLPPEAVADLTAWASEKGTLAIRAALTLGVHYQQAMAHECDPVLCQELRRQLADVHAPAMLRLELAKLLNQHNELDDDTLHRLIDPASPAPLRLIAVEALLARGDSTESIAALRELARLPNREIALACADVVQRRLGVSLGLARNQPLPSVQSRLAADVARRVLVWASQADGLDEALALRPEAQQGSRSYSELESDSFRG
jgi:hypothetical protein